MQLHDMILRREGLRKKPRKRPPPRWSEPRPSNRADPPGEYASKGSKPRDTSHASADTISGADIAPEAQRHRHWRAQKSDPPCHQSRALKQIIKVRRGKVREIQRDADNKPVLPLRAGVFSVISLGRVIYNNNEYHSERYIYPVGYTVERPYHSMIDKDKVVTYTCSIKEGPARPIFHVVAEDCPKMAINSNTATGAWIPVVSAISQLKKKDKSSSTSGPDNFGLSNPTISMLIQELDNARLCKNYVWKSFIEDVAPSQRKHPRGSAAASYKSSTQPPHRLLKSASHRISPSQAS